MQYTKTIFKIVLITAPIIIVFPKTTDSFVAANIPPNNCTNAPKTTEIIKNGAYCHAK